MALPKWFKIKGWEIGGTKAGTLQYQPHNTENWVDLGPWVIASGTNLRIDKARNPILIPYLDEDHPDGIFYGGGTWLFRLIDALGHPISNIVSFTFPGATGPLLNIDDTPNLNLDGTPLINI